MLGRVPIRKHSDYYIQLSSPAAFPLWPVGLGHTLQLLMQVPPALQPYAINLRLHLYTPAFWVIQSLTRIAMNR